VEPTEVQAPGRRGPAKASGLAGELEEARRQIAHLQLALQTNRSIGVAIGIVMARRGLTVDQSFELLRDVSQQTHRRIRDLAEEIVYTGELPEAPAG
jgi:AmiR/NasT family two-component response regulator